ncbi:MAG TPA: hypothetical protein VIO14_13890 [Dehalococcoidia bacterium]
MPKRSHVPGQRPRPKRRTAPAAREPRRPPPTVAVEDRRSEPAPPRPAPESRRPVPVRDYSYVIKDLQRIVLTTLVVAVALVIAVLILR